MKQLDNLAIIAVLGAAVVLSFFFTPQDVSARFIDLIVGGLLGYLAKAAQSPQ